MTKDLGQFEHHVKKRLQEFQTSDPTHSHSSPSPAASKGLTVILAVRNKELGGDYEFVHDTGSISRLEARLEAERAARAAGWRIIGHVVDYRTRE